MTTLVNKLMDRSAISRTLQFLKTVGKKSLVRNLAVIKARLPRFHIKSICQELLMRQASLLFHVNVICSDCLHLKPIYSTRTC